MLAVRIVTDHKNRFPLIAFSVDCKRQDSLVISQHRNGFLRCLKELLFIPVVIVSAWIPLSVQHMQFVHHIEDMHHLLVQLLHAHVTVLHGFLQRLSEEIIIEIISDTHVNIHRHIACLHRIVDSTPVGYANALKAPFFPQDIIEQIFMMAAMGSPETIISTHDTKRSAPRHRSLKCREIQFSERSLTDLCIHTHSLILLIVQCIMLHTGRHIILLNPLNQRHNHLGCEAGILPHILKVPAAQRTPEQIDARRQDHILASSPCFLPEDPAAFRGEFPVPGSRNRRIARKIGTLIICHSDRDPFILPVIKAHPHRSVREPERRDAQTLYAFCGKKFITVYHPDLFFQCDLVT